MRVLALDPGPELTGYCLWDGAELEAHGVADAHTMLRKLEDFTWRCPDALAIEMIASYGMAVGREVFETCVMIGEYRNQWRRMTGQEAILVYRQEVKMFLCGGQTKAKDANVRQAIIDLFPRRGEGKVPQIGTKKKPGPLFGVTDHVWPALGVAMLTRKRLLDEAARPAGVRPTPRRRAIR